MQIVCNFLISMLSRHQQSHSIFMPPEHLDCPWLESLNEVVEQREPVFPFKVPSLLVATYSTAMTYQISVTFHNMVPKFMVKGKGEMKLFILMSLTEDNFWN